MCPANAISIYTEVSIHTIMQITYKSTYLSVEKQVL